METVTMLKSIRGYLILIFVIIIYPALFILHCAVTVYGLVVPKHYYKLEDFIWGWYQEVVVYCYEIISSVKLKVHGNIPSNLENAILISNHQTAMDWVVADFLAARQGMVGHMRFVFKDMLKYFPMFGYVWGTHGGVFVKRDGSYNISNMEKTLNNLKERLVPFYLVIFPEGTRYAKGMKKELTASQDFLRQKQLAVLNNVLTPRAKAFYYSVKVLRNELDAIYDVTILYENFNCENYPPSMLEALQGRCKCVHVIFTRIPIDDIPKFQSQDDAFHWLLKTFHKKDEQMELFKNQNSNFETKFPVMTTPTLSRTRLLFSTLSVVLLTLLLFCIDYGYTYIYTIIYGTVFCWIYAFLVF